MGSFALRLAHGFALASCASLRWTPREHSCLHSFARTRFFFLLASVLARAHSARSRHGLRAHSQQNNNGQQTTNIVCAELALARFRALALRTKLARLKQNNSRSQVFNSYMDMVLVCLGFSCARWHSGQTNSVGLLRSLRVLSDIVAPRAFALFPL